MSLGQHRGQLKTIEELLHVQRESSPMRCTHCNRDSHDHERDLVEDVLRMRIRELEERVAKVEAWLNRLS
ncbi:MAG: hypothetical protein ABIY55_15020 [Kofleriaceae bacterium]